MRRVRLAVIILTIGIAFAACARSEERPSGVAESWLQEVGNQGRAGIRADAQERAARLGDPGLAVALIPRNPQPDKRYFSDLEVGKAQVSADDTKAQVPYRLTARVEQNGKAGKVVKAGTLVLDRSKTSWYVTSLAGPHPDLAVPSQGGPLPARAKGHQWLAALLLGLALTAVSVLVVERQPKVAVGSQRVDGV